MRAEGVVYAEMSFDLLLPEFLGMRVAEFATLLDEECARVAPRRSSTSSEPTRLEPPMQSDLVIRSYDERDAAAVVALWQRCGLVVSANDPYHDIALKLQIQRELFLVGTLDGHVVATVMAGYEGHRGWINYLAVSPDVQRRGFGRRMMEAAETKLRQLGAPKINLQVRGTNSAVIEFYRRLGFAIEDRVSMGKRLA